MHHTKGVLIEARRLRHFSFHSYLLTVSSVQQQFGKSRRKFLGILISQHQVQLSTI
jgi:hypothetical protein